MSYALMGLGEVNQAEVTTKIVALASQARNAADKMKKDAAFSLQRWDMAEWADTFKQQLDGMVENLLKVQSNGRPVWLNAPKTLEAVSGFVTQAIQDQRVNAASAPTGPLTAVAIGFQKVAQEASALATSLGRSLVQGALVGAGEAGGIGGQAALVGGVALVALLAAAYVWRAFK